MTEIERIQGLMRRAFSGPAWHGPSLSEALQGIGAQQASARPLERAHTIWEIVNHLIVWKVQVRRRLQGERTPALTPEQDWPAVPDTSEAAWSTTMAALEEAHTTLLDAVGAADAEQLDRALATEDGEVWSNYSTLHGSIHHDLYHAGQISLLRKAS